MENGYKILWTNNALSELESTYNYLEKHWSKQVLKNLSLELDRTLNLISENPELFPLSHKKGIRRVVIKRYNTLYYRDNKENKTIEILSFFSNRKNPDSLEI